MAKFVLSQSLRGKIAATVIAVAAFVLFYEVSGDDAVFPWRTVEVFDPSRPQPGARLQFDATAYCKGNTTASGVEVRTGIAAADPSLLPVGSVLTVTTDNPRYNGVYTVMDTGPEVKGREIDLYLWSCNEALAFGRKQVQVTVLRLGWNPAASTPSVIDRLFRRQAARRPAPTPTPADIPPAAVPPADADTLQSPDSGEPPAPGSAEPTPAPVPPPAAAPAPAPTASS